MFLKANDHYQTQKIGLSGRERNSIRLGKYKGLFFISFYWNKNPLQGNAIAVGGWSTLTGEILSLDNHVNEWSAIKSFPCSMGCNSKGP